MLLDWSFEPGALFKGERVIAVLKELIGECDIETLPIDFTAVATDISARNFMERGFKVRALGEIAIR